MKVRLTIAFAALLAGCAGQGELRRLAGDSAALLNDYRREMAAFAERQTTLNADIQRRAQHYAEDRELVEGATRQQLLALDVAGDKPALDAYRLVASVSADDILAQTPLLRSAAPTASAPAVTFDTASVERVTRQLNALRQSPSYWQRVTRIIAYRDELREAYERSLGQASDEASRAVQSAAVADQAQPAPGS